MYGVAIGAASIPFRHEHEYIAYRSAFLLSGFIASFAMYPLCRFLWRRSTPVFPSFVIAIAMSYVLGSLCSAVSQWSEIRFGGSTMAFHWDSAFAGATGASFVLIAWSGFHFGLKHYYALEQERTRLLQAEAMAREAQLRALRYQLQPHFLFNTLNAISTLVLDNQPHVATRMISRLSDLLRNTLDAPDAHQVPLAEELAVTEEYLAIEEIRFGPRLKVLFEIEDDVRQALVPRFLLQPLVENSVRHGIAKLPQGGHIFIRAAVRGDHLCCEIENEVPLSQYGATETTSGSPGVGLSNTRARLGQLYGSSATIKISDSPDGNFRVLISMPFRVDELRVQDREFANIR